MQESMNLGLLASPPRMLRGRREAPSTGSLDFVLSVGLV